MKPPVKKRKCDTSNEKNLAEICSSVKVVLLDIEGTTTPITFVTQVLFPYVKSNLQSYLESNFGDEKLSIVIEKLQEQCKSDIAAKMGCSEDLANVLLNDEKENVISSVVEYVLWLMANDRKVSSLKLLQGKILKDAYQSGKIKGDVYQDVKPAIEALVEAGKSVYIYSSGSVEAQKLLFRHTEDGNMLSLLEGHFDTEIGDKKTKDSYVKIAKTVNVEAKDILFLTDVALEADAAIAAGCKVFIVCRPGNKLIPEPNNYTTIDDFSVLT